MHIVLWVYYVNTNKAGQILCMFRVIRIPPPVPMQRPNRQQHTEMSHQKSRAPFIADLGHGLQHGTNLEVCEWVFLFELYHRDCEVNQNFPFESTSFWVWYPNHPPSRLFLVVENTTGNRPGRMIKWYNSLATRPDIWTRQHFLIIRYVADLFFIKWHDEYSWMDRAISTTSSSKVESKNLFAKIMVAGNTINCSIDYQKDITCRDLLITFCCLQKSLTSQQPSPTRSGPGACSKRTNKADLTIFGHFY